MPPDPPSAARVDGRRLSHSVSATVRRLATEAVARGERPSAVMARLGLCRTTIYRWLSALKRLGPTALERRRHPGRLPRVAQARAAELRDLVVDHSPGDHGLPARLWTRAAVRDLVRVRFGITLGLAATGRLLLGVGLRPHVGIVSAGTPTAGPGLLFAVDGRGAFLCARLSRACGPRDLHRRMDELHRQGRRAVRFVVVAESREPR